MITDATAKATFSQELLHRMEELTPMQRRAIPRIVATLAQGGALTSLLSGGPARANKPASNAEAICSWKTWYHRPKGWSHQAAFTAALEQAQQEFDEALMERAVDEAAERMKRMTLLAVDLAEKVLNAALMGDQVENLPPAVQTLLTLMEEGETESTRRLAAQALLTKAMTTGFGVLDRADVATAIKASGADAQRWEAMLDELRDLEEDEDGETMADLAPEAGDFSEAGVLAARTAATSAQEQSSGDSNRRGGAER